MKPRIYIETTIPSYLTAWPSRNLLVAAHQVVTRDWWAHRRHQFDLYVSPAVIHECQGGDAEAAAARVEAIRGLEVLDETDAARSLARLLVDRLNLPQKSAIDGLHIAVSAVHGIDYLLTWNCTHIANATHRTRIEAACREAGWRVPVICTPLDLSADEVERG